jgi:uncharacterized OB-fold protein
MRPAGLPIGRCRACGTVLFPQRAVCPRCWSTDLEETVTRRGTVEQVTHREHRPREMRRPPVGGWDDRVVVWLASVRTEAGPVVIAWCPEELRPGAVVELGISSGVPTARAATPA